MDAEYQIPSFIVTPEDRALYVNTISRSLEMARGDSNHQEIFALISKASKELPDPTNSKRSITKAELIDYELLHTLLVSVAEGKRGLDTLEYLLNHGICDADEVLFIEDLDDNHCQICPLNIAVDYNNAEMAKMLLSKGASPLKEDTIYNSIEIFSIFGPLRSASPYQTAINNNNLNMLQIFTEYGYDSDQVPLGDKLKAAPDLDTFTRLVEEALDGRKIDSTFVDKHDIQGVLFSLLLSEHSDSSLALADLVARLEGPINTILGTTLERSLDYLINEEISRDKIYLLIKGIDELITMGAQVDSVSLGDICNDPENSIITLEEIIFNDSDNDYNCSVLKKIFFETSLKSILITIARDRPDQYWCDTAVAVVKKLYPDFDFNFTDIDNKMTLLMYAAEAGNEQFVDTLTVEGVNPTFKNRVGKTASELARMSGHVVLANQLKEDEIAWQTEHHK